MMKTTPKFLVFLFLLAISFVTFLPQSFAGDKDFPALPNPPKLVNDFGGFLKQSEEADLERKLLAYADSTSNEIAIVTVETIGDYDISDYTVQLFNRWKIGGKKNNNGLLILAAKDERKIWITTGYGLEGVLPDGAIGSIIRGVIEPNFKEGNFYLGFEEGTNELMKAARGEYVAEPKKAVKKKGDWFTSVIILVLIFFFLSRFGGKGGGGGGGMLGNAGWIAASMLSNRGGGFAGGGFGGSSGGGGFGGFGGGSSGGGGAGGSW